MRSVLCCGRRRKSLNVVIVMKGVEKTSRFERPDTSRTAHIVVHDFSSHEDCYSNDFEEYISENESRYFIYLNQNQPTRH